MPSNLCEVDRMKTPPELDRIADKVLAYRPKPRTKAAHKRKRLKSKIQKEKKPA